MFFTGVNMKNNIIKSPIIQYLTKTTYKLGVGVIIIDQEKGIFALSKGNKKVFLHDYTFDINNNLTSQIVNDKVLTKKILGQYNIPTPEGVVEDNFKNVINFLNKKIINFPLVVKPVDGKQGGAVTAAIYKRKYLLRAIQEVQKYNKKKKSKANSFIVEKYIPGQDFRFLVLDHKVLTVIRREPAYVIGDGKKTISQLIRKYNSNSRVGKQKPLCPIVCDFELERNLELKKLTKKSIISKNKKIYLRKNANVSTGGRSFECANKVCQRYKNLASRISKIFNLRFCAVDIIIPNPQKFEKFAVIEVNHTPGFDIHEAPYRGRPFPVGKCLVESIFKQVRSIK